MKIGVCAKVVPDTDTRIVVAASGDGIDPSGVKYVISPYDLFAIEETLATKEKLGGETAVYTVGNDDDLQQIRVGALALGIDRGVIISDNAVANAGSLGVAKALAAAAKKDGIELLFTGKVAIDDDAGQVPAMIAETLGWPHVSNVVEFSADASGFTATRAMDGGVREVVKGSFPAVITADRGLNNPRRAKLPDIMKAKKKAVDTLDAAALGLSADDLAPRVALSGFGLPPARAKGRILDGDVDTVVNQLVTLLRDEAKVL